MTIDEGGNQKKYQMNDKQESEEEDQLAVRDEIVFCGAGEKTFAGALPAYPELPEVAAGEFYTPINRLCSR